MLGVYGDIDNKICCCGCDYTWLVCYYLFEFWTMKVISLGWGSQSFVLAAMSALGKLPKVDFAIHSDTTHERTETYAFAEKWTPWLEERGVRVVTVRDTKSAVSVVWSGSVPAYTLKQVDVLDKYGCVEIPAMTSTPSAGQLKRSCTGRWKLAPMRRYISKELKGLGLKKTPGVVEQWIGISLDEMTRMKLSDVKYITSRWPLVEMKMTRHDCERWLRKHDLEIPVRSACVFCPYHDKKEWRSIKDADSDDWEKATGIDELIRKARPPYDLYLTSQHVPLVDADFTTPEDHGQLSLWNDECDGVCGL